MRTIFLKVMKVPLYQVKIIPNYRIVYLWIQAHSKLENEYQTAADKVHDLEAENKQIKDRQEEIEKRWSQVKQVRYHEKTCLKIKKIVPSVSHVPAKPSLFFHMTSTLELYAVIIYRLYCIVGVEHAFGMTLLVILTHVFE